MDLLVSDIGERGLIRRLRKKFPSLSGMGDDSAVLPELRCPVVTTDSFFEGTHFYRWWAPPRILGRRLLDPSDAGLFCTRARAGWIFTAITLDPGMRVNWIDEFYQGLTERDDIILAGGETIRGEYPGITLTIVGEGDNPETLLRRSSLHPGDVLWVSGPVGRALNAPSLLERIGGFDGADLIPRRRSISGPELTRLREFLQPRAELELGIELRNLGIRCAIDISDGLISEAEHLSIESGVSVVLDLDKSIFFNSVQDNRMAASAAGEDFVLLFGAGPGMDFSSMGCSPVGRAESGKSGVTVFLDGEEVDIIITGYDHMEE